MIGKKAQGLSLNTIIIAVLVLIVMVVLIVIFSGKIGEFGTGTKACPGECAGLISECQNNIGYKLESCEKESATTPICCPSGKK